MPSNDRILSRMRETAARFPWYADLAGSVRPDELPPLLTAGVLDEYLYRQPPSDPPPFSYSTSGTSSGIRKTIYYSHKDEQRYLEVKSRLFGEWLSRSGSPVRKALSDMGTGHAAGTADQVFARIGLECESVSFELPIGKHLEKLEAFRPDVLYTMPSILDRIVRAAGNPERFGIRKIITVGEIAPPSWQRGIAEKFGIRPEDILDTLGSIEIGTIAAYSHELNRYVLAEGLWAEAVGTEELGEGYDPLPPDEKVLVLTSFDRDAFPAVRYVTYDVVRGFETVLLDGIERQTFEGIVKRIGPELKHGEKISLYDIEEALLRHARDVRWSVEVNGGRLTVTVQSPSLQAEDVPVVRDAIENQIPAIGAMIRGGLLTGIEVRLLSPEAPPPEHGGIKTRKIRYGKAGAP